jgi:endonuclease/exonuclease/phosphatase family metal-dependent hydrolase
MLHPDEEEAGTAHGFRGGRTGPKIDYVLVPARTPVEAAEIRHDERGGRYPSDHFPVAARVVLAAR